MSSRPMISYFEVQYVLEETLTSRSTPGCEHTVLGCKALFMVHTGTKDQTAKQTNIDGEASSNLPVLPSYKFFLIVVESHCHYVVIYLYYQLTISLYLLVK